MFCICFSYRDGQFKRVEARKKLDTAIKDRNLREITESLNICVDYGVDATTIHHGERVRNVVQEEDQLIHDIQKFLKNEDFGNLITAIDKFRYKQAIKLGNVDVVSKV